jgi:hypothetical protein
MTSQATCGKGHGKLGKNKHHLGSLWRALQLLPLQGILSQLR